MNRRKRALIAAGLLSSAALFWRFVAAPWREDRQWLYAARTALKALAELEQSYCFQSGRYTGNLLTLASLAPEPGGISGMAGSVLEPGSLRFQIEPDAVTISARARDRRRTLLASKARKPKP